MSDGEDEDDEKRRSWWRGGNTALLSTAMKRKDYDNIEHKPVADIQYTLFTKPSARASAHQLAKQPAKILESGGKTPVLGIFIRS